MAIRRTVVSLALALALVGCGAVDAVQDAAEEASKQEDLNGGGSGDDSGGGGRSVEFDPAVGWQIAGPDGTTVDVVETFTSNGAEQSSTNSYTIADEPRFGLYTAFVDSASHEVTVTSGGPVTFEMFIGHTIEGGEFGEYEVDKVLDTVEIAAGESATLSAVRPDPEP